jgi:ribosomal-protein-alanine N-acetyltransferase
VTLVATTPHLLLRHWTPSDIPATEYIYGDPETMSYFGDGSTFSPEELAASFPDVIAEYARVGYGNYAVIERAGGTIIGHCGVRYHAGRNCNEADWLIHRSFWRRGYGTEAAAAVFQRSFTVDHVPTIFGISHRDNGASIALMKRLGMKFRESLRANERPSVLYELAAKDFRAPRAPIVIPSLSRDRLNRRT